MMEAAKDEVRDVINFEILEPSESPYCSSALIVKKKDNTNIVCIDFRTLNKVTVSDAEPMPNMKEIFMKIAGEERANLCAFRMFVRFVLVWICRFPPPLGVWEGLEFVIVALPGHFSYLFSTDIYMAQHLR